MNHEVVVRFQPSKAAPPQYYLVVATFKAPVSSPDHGHVVACLNWLVGRQNGMPFIDNTDEFPSSLLFTTCITFAIRFFSLVFAETGSAHGVCRICMVQRLQSACNSAPR